MAIGSGDLSGLERLQSGRTGAADRLRNWTKPTRTADESMPTYVPEKPRGGLSNLLRREREGDIVVGAPGLSGDAATRLNA